MSQSIVTIDHIQAKARAAHAEGKGRDDHGFNWHAPALRHWQAEWDRCEAARIIAGAKGLAERNLETAA